MTNDRNTQGMKMEKSSITNCHFVTRPGDLTLFDFEKGGGNAAIVTLDRFLIAPLEMFSERQLKMALKKWHKTRRDTLSGTFSIDPLPGK